MPRSCGVAESGSRSAWPAIPTASEATDERVAALSSEMWLLERRATATGLHRASLVILNVRASFAFLSQRRRLTNGAAGVYTLVVSTFLPAQEGEFSLNISSTLPLEASLLPQEGAGMFSRIGRGAWCVPSRPSRKGADVLSQDACIGRW